MVMIIEAARVPGLELTNKQRERWLKLAAFLQHCKAKPTNSRRPGKRKDGYFNMDLFVFEDCGTPACMLGWATVVFPEELEIRREICAMFNIYSIESTEKFKRNARRRGMGRGEITEFFGSLCPFYELTITTPKQAAAYIRKFVKVNTVAKPQSRKPRVRVRRKQAEGRDIAS